MTRPKTIICDIDGCVFRHKGNLSQALTGDCELLPGVLERFNEWDRNSYKILLVTGRKESSRPTTEAALRNAGLFWDFLVMGAGCGQRILINDIKPREPNEMTAVAINLIRDQGFENVNV